MAPLDKTVFIDPLDVSAFVASPENTSPGFTQDIIDILGDQAGPLDGFDELLAGAGELLDAWDAASAAQDADLDAILALHDSTNPAPLDNSLAGYVNSFSAGNDLIHAADVMPMPQLGLFPINSQFTNGIPAAPLQQSQDLGTVKLNSAPITVTLGRAIQIGNDYSGMVDPGLASGDATIFQVNTDEQDTASGNQRFTFSVTVSPLKVGTFSALVTWFTAQGFYQEIQLTLSVTVVP